MNDEWAFYKDITALLGFDEGTYRSTVRAGLELWEELWDEARVGREAPETRAGMARMVLELFCTEIV